MQIMTTKILTASFVKNGLLWFGKIIKFYQVFGKWGLPTLIKFTEYSFI